MFISNYVKAKTEKGSRAGLHLYHKSDWVIDIYFDELELKNGILTMSNVTIPFKDIQRDDVYTDFFGKCSIEDIYWLDYWQDALRKAEDEIGYWKDEKRTALEMIENYKGGKTS